MNERAAAQTRRPQAATSASSPAGDAVGDGVAVVTPGEVVGVEVAASGSSPGSGAGEQQQRQGCGDGEQEPRGAAVASVNRLDGLMPSPL